MPLVRLFCTQCGASVEFSDNLKVVFCNHCGNKYLVENVGGETHLRAMAEQLEDIGSKTKTVADASTLGVLDYELGRLYERKRNIEFAYSNHMLQHKNASLWRPARYVLFIAAIILFSHAFKVDGGEKIVSFFLFGLFLAGGVVAIVKSSFNKKRPCCIQIESDYEEVNRSIFQLSQRKEALISAVISAQ